MGTRRPKAHEAECDGHIEGVRGPAPRTVAPQLATLVKTAPDGDGFLHEIKFDGYRMIAHVANGKTRIWSRNELDWTARFPELADSLAALPVHEAIFDGEVVHMRSDGVTKFGALQTDLSEKRTADLKYMIFDLIYLDGYRLEASALIARKNLLALILESSKDDRIRYSEHQVGRGQQFFAAAAAVPLEGIVSKKCDAPYRSGRGAEWLKVKALGREELIVVGFTDPENSRVGFGSLLLGYYRPGGQLIYGGKVGTGFSDKLLRTLRRRLDDITQIEAIVALPKGISRTGVHWVKPEIVIETEFTEWTTDGVLRHPAFLGIREDKPAKDVVLDRSFNPDAKTTHWRKRKRV